jgi:hypothetical protein
VPAWLVVWNEAARIAAADAAIVDVLGAAVGMVG